MHYIIIPYTNKWDAMEAKDLLEEEVVRISYRDYKKVFKVYFCKEVIEKDDRLNILTEEDNAFEQNSNEGIGYCILYPFKTKEELLKGAKEVIASRRGMNSIGYNYSYWQVDIAEADEGDVNKLKEKSRKLLIWEEL
jgi:hypothetical protein